MYVCSYKKARNEKLRCGCGCYNTCIKICLSKLNSSKVGTHKLNS